MEFGMCNLAVIPVRKEPSDRAEMTTQLLFGDLFEILQALGPWLQVRNYFDDYEGWIDFKQVAFLSGEDYNRLRALPLYVNRRHSQDVIIHHQKRLHLPAGCSFFQEDDAVFRAGNETYEFHGLLHRFEFANVADVIDTAKGYLSCPYLWGGKTFMGLDCSGLTQSVFKQHGIRLLRDAVQQSAQGELINLLSEGEPGDLAFFDHDDGVIAHVGILISQTHLIHCSGLVRIDPVDHYGIYNTDLKRYTHALRVIRRVLPGKF
jgi:hypothetical protein